MSLWGKSDNLTIPGAPSVVTVVGTAGSEFWTASGLGLTVVPTGTTIVLSSGTGAIGDAGFAVVESILGPDLVKVNIRSCVPNLPVQPGVPGSWGADYTQQPIQIGHDPGYNGWSALVGVTTSGAAVTQNVSFADIGRTQMPVGISTDEVDRLNADGATAQEKLFRTSAGWVGVMTYMSLDPETGISTMRVKKEVYVAMSGIETGLRAYPENFAS